MAELTISAAARHCGVDRRTLQRAIASGRLTRTASGQVTLEALQQAGYAAPVSQVTPHDAACTPQVMPSMPHLSAAGTPPEAPHHMPQGFPPELAMATTLLAHLEALTSTIATLHQEVVLLREDLRRTPQRRRRLTPQVAHHATVAPLPDAAPAPHHDTLTPQETPHYVAEMPHVTPQEPATPANPPALPAHILRIAEVAAEYHRLTLVDLSQLLFDRGIYRARDRKTGVEKPVNKGTLQAWLVRARQAGML